MTDKEKVLKVNPNASAWQATDFEWRITDCGTGAIDLGRGRTEEAAWQNAAESLPAQQEQDYERCDNCDGAISEGPQGWVHEDSDQKSCERAQPGEHPRADCEGCNKPDCPCNTGEGDDGWMGMFSNNPPEPVAPVEAKEKERYEASDEYIRGFERCKELAERIVDEHLGYLDRIGHLDPVTSVAEPKPTPSTPAEQVMAAVNWAMGCSDDDFVKPENAPTYWWRRELAKRAGIIYDGQKYVKPQPDLSSISSEQTFEDWKNSEEGRCMIHKALPEDAARCAWAAAKGSK